MQFKMKLKTFLFQQFWALLWIQSNEGPYKCSILLLLLLLLHIHIYSGISQTTNFNAFKIHWHVSLQTLQNINTSHQHSKNYTGFLSKKESITKSVFSHTKPLQINNLHIWDLYNSLPITFCFYRIFWFTCFFHSICPIITWQKGFLCHQSTTLKFTPSWYPKLVFSANIPFQAQNTLYQNCQDIRGSKWTPWPFNI